MKTRINIATSNGYILDNGKLTAYEFKSAKVDFATGSVEYDCILGGVPTTFKAEECPKVYADETAFQKGEERMREYTYGNAVASCFFGVPYDVDEMIPAYRVVDGEPVRTNLPLADFVLRGYWWTYEGEGAFYETRKEAMLYCDIVKVEADGTEVRCPSPASLVALNEEQKKAVQAVEEALARASELGVEFGHDITDDEMFAYSNTHILDTDWGYDGEHISGFGYCINDLVTPMKSRPFLSYSRCESRFLVKFK